MLSISTRITDFNDPIAQQTWRIIFVLIAARVFVYWHLFKSFTSLQEKALELSATLYTFHNLDLYFDQLRSWNRLRANTIVHLIPPSIEKVRFIISISAPGEAHCLRGLVKETAHTRKQISRRSKIQSTIGLRQSYSLNQGATLVKFNYCIQCKLCLSTADKSGTVCYAANL